MATEYKFFGWLGKDKEAGNGKMVWEEYTPKTWSDDDVDVKITHCGICASDIHILRSDWGPADYPVCVGHEIVGSAVRVGKNVSHVKFGDRVAVGAQADSCHNCDMCKSGQESYCLNNMTLTCNSRFSDKSKSYGGYANYTRVNGTFVFKVPDSIPSEIVAPMMCGGVTAYSPLKYHGAGTTAKNVGIVGIGGLGHFGLLFAKALGAEVYAISTTASKKEDAIKMGASHFIATKDNIDEAFKPYLKQLDLILVTISDANMPIDKYITLLRPRTGKIVFVGVPEKPINFPVLPFIFAGANFAGSLIGGTKDINDMLQLAASQQIKSWVNARPMKEANQAILDMGNGKARYRFVLVNEDNL